MPQTNTKVPFLRMELLWKTHMRVQVIRLFCGLLLVTLLSSEVAESRKGKTVRTSFEYKAINCRGYSASLTDFGGVGDGKTSNTKAFQSAISHLSQYASKGGAQLYVPAGKWLTGSFSLCSHFTLYLNKDAVLLASQDIREWPVIEPLPSYGRGRDAAAGRYTSLIFGTNLTDVIVTGDNGTIDGQGAFWWQKFHKKKLKYTRPYLIEFMFSDKIQISNLTLLNSPSWNVHPVYSSNIIIKGLTIIAPVPSPNTDGINPDSCTNTRIEDCYIVSGDDCVAVKSGWDEYGIKDVMADNVTIAATFEGISNDPFTGICIANVTINMAAKAKKQPWTCSDIEGITTGVTPKPCNSLPDQGPEKIKACDFPKENLPIDSLKLKKCAYSIKHA
uniref:Polygalacturonase n=1 Tax=Cajanus cajan TaxID=3821 RepID=A0A151UCX6_CAJCA|nr:putative polygalacturonase [Cajanus cajan]